jgi:hypothetical protein
MTRECILEKQLGGVTLAKFWLVERGGKSGVPTRSMSRVGRRSSDYQVTKVVRLNVIFILQLLTTL